jgi:nucleotide-binding universal stress UspA family protein
MYKRILVPLDGSERAEAVIPHVANLAKHDDAEVIFTQVVEPATRSAVLDLEEAEVAFKTQKTDQVKQYLTGWKEKFQEKGLTASILLLRGIAVEAILHALDITQADLIAMSSKGHTGLAQVFSGSVAAGLLNRVECPMLLVQSATDADKKTNNRIVVPLDGFPHAEEIIPHVEGIAKLYNAKIILVRVVRSGYQTSELIDIDREIKEEEVSEKLFDKLGRHQEIEQVKEAKQYLLSWQSQLQERGFEVEARLLHGHPIESIMEVAERVDADLIAMTSHGKSGLAQVFYGSVASGLLNRADCPLLLVKSGEPEKPVENFV